jgi:hypothetical protein
MKLKKKQDKGKIFKFNFEAGSARQRFYAWLMAQRIHSAHEERTFKSIKRDVESGGGLSLKEMTQGELERIPGARLEFTKEEIEQINTWRDRHRGMRDQSGQQIGTSGLDLHFLEDVFEFCDDVIADRYQDPDEPEKAEDGADDGKPAAPQAAQPAA